MNRLIGQAASQYQGKDRERFIRYVQQEPMAAAQLRAPLYEDKVVDFLFSKAEISDRTATRAELEADLESEEGHVHGPGCGHDHAARSRRRRRPPRKGLSFTFELVCEDFDLALDCCARRLPARRHLSGDEPHTAILSRGRAAVRLTSAPDAPPPGDLPPFGPNSC
jgi:hypothetical protein